MSDLSDLARDLERAPEELHSELRAIVKRGAQNVKSGARKRAQGIRHGPHYPQSITYDTSYTGDGAEAVIGPDANIGQGFLGRVYEYGTVKSGPIPHMSPALAEEEPRFFAALHDAIGDALWQ